ncbi:hypothetical protein N8864_03570 [Gammaproteobacteria bacterium]|jgi:hypothetical protein|nr:hypothetical protein [Gammaproteobacteria bacterium]MDA7829745.1 hypothetical protein [Gammaproteobacteria bacterium]MDA9039739.1 hypothetical protein [Gammaproteobacteria bacterium]
MFDFAFSSISEAILMESQNGQNHGIYVWSVFFIVFGTLLVTFSIYKNKIRNLSKKIK